MAIHKVAWIAKLLKKECADHPVFCIALHDKKEVEHLVWASPNDEMGLTIRYVYNEGDLNSLNELIDLLDRYQPAFMCLKPSILASIIDRIENFTSLIGYIPTIISSGAILPHQLRARGQQLLGTVIINLYGLSEVGVVASECNYQDGLHVYEDNIITEILTEDGKLVEEGEGELIISSAANAAMPFLRYKTGDIVKQTTEICPCGRKGRRIETIFGRYIFNFKLKDGSEFAPTNLNKLFRLFPLQEFRITQVQIDRLQVEVNFKNGTPGKSEKLEEIKNYIEKQMDFLVSAEVFTSQFTNLMEFQRYVSLT